MQSKGKMALIRLLALRAKRICSAEYLQGEIAQLKSILQRNGYPIPFVGQVIGEVLKEKPTVLTAELKPVYIHLLWMGAITSAFRNRIELATKKVVP